MPLLLFSASQPIAALAILFNPQKFQMTHGAHLLIPSITLQLFAFLTLIHFWWRSGTLCPMAVGSASRRFRAAGLAFATLAVVFTLLALGFPFLVSYHYRGVPGTGIVVQMALWIDSIIVGYAGLTRLPLSRSQDGYSSHPDHAPIPDPRNIGRFW
ncbi:MAG: hypothetical protein LBJ59_04335 [Zoogloeaceae bacterium]|nr:hypothetical protein [Zoogloeaceae bacterium]